ncbi:endonuclease [Nostoc sp. CALU 546]|uniref:endonuclease n=1 Tax=Nostoc sp. CALU 546 TaxID=1867241 RepID=UPI003B681BE0
MQVGKSEELREWTRKVIEKMPNLTKPQAVVLAMWTFGIVMTQSSGLTTVSVFLAELLGKKENTIRQQLREWYRDAEDKTKTGRTSLDVTSCFSPLLSWILSLWPKGEKRLALAADASTLSDRFTVLAISIVYRGCGIPIAWKIVEATIPGSWKPHWEELFRHIDKTVPPDWFVIVTTDRGLYAEWLYQQILNCGWHPFMRINLQGQFQIKGTVSWLPLNTLVREVGQSFESLVTCFKSNPIECTLLARHDEGYAEPWLILTDLQPEVADACWYSMRSWIECLFKDGKRGGFAWHQTKMTDTKRAERHWLAIAIATLWQVSVGGAIDANLPISSLDELPQTHVARRNLKNSVFHRCLSCFRRGFLVIKAAVLNRLPLPQGSFFPEPWPSLTPQLHVSQITLSTA